MASQKNKWQDGKDMTQTVVEPCYVHAVSCLLACLVPLTSASVPPELSCTFK